ncbi:hypothetical protein ACKWRH_21625 [Bradyrhizobium sp. Pa8]|uniref:hypothetical protein n=1 Tax=Bradyrhizobium sp. Pa8 TaxID=3386552 RepID=UPI00403F1647
MTLPVKDKKFDPSFALVDKDGRPTALFRDYMAMVDQLLTAMRAGNAPTLINAANDAAAAVAGVNIGQFYRNGSVVMMRVV